MKKLLKPLKIAILGPNLCKKGVSMGNAQHEKQFFFAEITKADHKLSKTFYFYPKKNVLVNMLYV